MKLFDAHVHIIPREIAAGYCDERYHITREHYGKIKTSSGYEMQLMPPYFEDSTFNADTLIETMNFNHVDKAAIMQGFCFPMNEAVARAVASYPDRLIGAMVLDLNSNNISELEYWKQRGLSIVKFEMSEGMGFCSRYAYPNFSFVDDGVVALFKKAEELNLTITIDPSRIMGPGYQVANLEYLAKTFPSLHMVICHLGVPNEHMKENLEMFDTWKKMISLAQYDNVWFDISALPALFKSNDYPFSKAIGYVKYFKEQYGTQKLIWGSDIPGTLLNATYTQMVDMFSIDDLITEEEKVFVFSANAEKAYRF